jgi:hypothetical protein
VPAGAGAAGGHAVDVPSQRAASVQAEGTAHTTSRTADTGPQVPSTAAPAATLQAMQSFLAPPPQAVSQQTPSTQEPERQSAPTAQAAPSATGRASKMRALGPSVATRARPPPAEAGTTGARFMFGKSEIGAASRTAPAEGTRTPT